MGDVVPQVVTVRPDRECVVKTRRAQRMLVASFGVIGAPRQGAIALSLRADQPSQAMEEQTAAKFTQMLDPVLKKLVEEIKFQFDALRKEMLAGQKQPDVRGSH